MRWRTTGLGSWARASPSTSVHLLKMWEISALIRRRRQLTNDGNEGLAMTTASAALGFAFHKSHFWAGGIEKQIEAEVDPEQMRQTLVFVVARQRRRCSAHGIERATA